MGNIWWSLSLSCLNNVIFYIFLSLDCRINILFSLDEGWLIFFKIIIIDIFIDIFPLSMGL